MTTPHQTPTELVAVFLERNGRDEFRFVPTCSGCGKLVLDLSQANVAVVGGTAARPEPVGAHNGAKVFRLNGRAHVFCWPCDREHGHNVPWSAATLVFRDRDDAAQQRLNPPFRSVTKRRVVEAGATR
jgi:hypothetical protein